MTKGKIIFISLLSGTAIVGGYYIYKRWKNNQNLGGQTDVGTAVADVLGHVTTVLTNPSSTGFPIKKGSTGQLVKDVQQSLVTLYGNVLPLHGIDSDFGSETEAALRNNGRPISLEKADYDRLTDDARAKFTQSLANKPLTANASTTPSGGNIYRGY